MLILHLIDSFHVKGFDFPFVRLPIWLCQETNITTLINQLEFSLSTQVKARLNRMIQLEAIYLSCNGGLSRTFIENEVHQNLIPYLNLNKKRFKI
jgi:hypothetical protein